MKSFLLFFCIFISLNSLKTQVVDDFSDGELLNNPTWQGEVEKFIVNDQGQLQLLAQEAGAAKIFTALRSADLFAWQLDVNMDFSPSAGNSLQIFLWADQDSLPLASGYAIQLGESGADDRLRLVKMVDGTPVELAQGSNSFGSDPNFTLRVKLNDNLWTVESRKDGDLLFQNEITYLEDQQLARSENDLFIITPTFTSTRLDKFFFDNLCISEQVKVDTSAPKLAGLLVLNGTTIRVTFSEAIDSILAENVGNYLLEPDGLRPFSANILPDLVTVDLTFEDPLATDLNYILVASDIRDLSGNQATSQWEFSYVQPRTVNAYEVVINEIYDDPIPSFGLPIAEYLELLIQTTDGSSINLGELIIKSFATEVALPAIEVPASTHLILCDPSDTAILNIYGKVIAVEDFPTLLNTGNDLEVRTLAGEILHKISYNDSWYGDNSKDDGGWSLEMINPRNACALDENWAASTSLLGGTPGQPNSVLDPEHSTSVLEVNNVVPLAPDRILVNFNKAISSVGFANFDLSGGDANVQVAITIGRNLEQALLIVDPPLQQGISYQLTVSNIDDCLKMPFEPEILEVNIPQQPEPRDILINEILFNPEVGGVDFIELFNNSDKSFQIQDLAFGNINDQGQQLRPIITPAILPPGAHFVFTPDPSDIELRYPPVNKKAIFRNLIPSLPDQFGNVSLIFQADGMPRIIDAFDYAETFHSSVLRDREGVSLERINSDGDTQDPANWHSAASIVGHATPTNLNSQRRDLGQVDQMFSINPARISPDGDGFEDFLTIDYQLPSTGYVAHVRIFDAAGRLVRYLINNESLATKGQIKWDGETDDGRKTPIGIYTILIEAVDQNGDSVREKELCVVAGKLN